MTTRGGSFEEFGADSEALEAEPVDGDPDRLLVHLTIRMRGRASGVPIDQPLSVACRFRDGLLLRWVACTTDAAARADVESAT